MSTVLLAAQDTAQLIALLPRVSDFIDRYRSEVIILITNDDTDLNEIDIAQTLTGAQSVDLKTVDNLAAELESITNTSTIDFVCLPNNSTATGSPGLFRSSISETLLKNGCSLLLACCEQSNEYKTILAPVDMGLNSRAAVDRASRFFPLTEIELLYAFQRHSDGMIDSPAAQSDCIPEVQKASGSDLKGQLSIFAQSLHRPDVISRRIVIEGDAKEVVFSQAGKINADLIVLGYKPRGSVAKLLSNSLVSQIVREAHYDIFLATVG